MRSVKRAYLQARDAWRMCTWKQFCNYGTSKFYLHVQAKL